jgi:hypothetical protein
MDQLIFMFFAVVLLGALIGLTYRTKSTMFGTMFGLSLLVLLAFYLLQWGHLGEFEVGALSAQAKFIKEKKQAVEADAGDIAALKRQSEQRSQEAAQILSRLRETEQEVGEAKRLVDEVSRKNSEAGEKITILDKAIQEGKRAVSDLQAYTLFNSTILAAQNDDRRAFDQLWKWADDNTYPFQKAAVQAVQTIMDQHDPTLIRRGFTVPWKEGIEPQRLTLQELWAPYTQAVPAIRIGVIEFVWEKRTELPKKERLNFLAEVLRSDESLQVVEYAGRYFAQGTGNNLKPLAIPIHLKWWDEH